MTNPQDHHSDNAGSDSADSTGPQPPQYRRAGDEQAGGGAGQAENPWSQPGGGQQWQQPNPYSAGQGYGQGHPGQGYNGQGGQWQGQPQQGQYNQGPYSQGPYNQGPYNPAPPPQGPQGGQWQGQGYPQGPGYEQQEEPKSGGRNVLVIVLVVLAVIAAVAFAFFMFSGTSDDKGSGSDQATVSSTQDGGAGEDEDQAGDDGEEATTEEDEEDEEGADDEEADSRPANPNLPGYATPVNESATSPHPGGDLNSVWKSGPTSDSFALSVRDAYVDAYLDGDPDEFNHVVEVYSDVTGTTYTMNCSDNGEYVHCTGGNDANVYIA